ncbi:MAG: glycosyltransferase family 4 protein [Nitrospinae bacterium]|nr:glycosyltransferase family 4 protein [Nitrospinota bacterium]
MQLRIPSFGGRRGVVNALLARELAKRHDVTVLTSQALGLPKNRVEDGVKVVRVPVFFRTQEAAADLLSMLMFLPIGISVGKRLVQQYSYDVVNTHFVLPSGPVGEAVARHGCLPNVLSLHGGDLFDPSKWTSPHRHGVLRMWIRWLLRRADRVVGQSNNTIENVRRFYDQEISPACIPLGIERPKLMKSSREDFGFPEEEVLLITIGRLIARKAVDHLIAVMERFKGVPVRLLVVGCGPQEGSLQNEVRQRQIDGQVQFLGHVSEETKFRLLQISDVYVSSSQHEGFGLVFLEAMACGLPVVCYNHGGQTDFLRNGENGFLVPLNSIDILEKKCRELINNSELRRLMGEKNKRAAEDYFIDQCALKYERVFYEALDQPALAV